MHLWYFFSFLSRFKRLFTKLILVGGRLEKKRLVQFFCLWKLARARARTPNCTRNHVVTYAKEEFSSAKLPLRNPLKRLMGEHLTSLWVNCLKQFEIYKLHFFCFVFFYFLLFFFNIPRGFIALWTSGNCASLLVSLQ